MEKTRPLVSFSGADLGYNKTVVLESVNFELCQGDYVGIIGPNGSGKTTLLKTILGTLPAISGKAEVAAGVDFGYVMQRQYLDNIFPFTVREIVMMGRYGKIGPVRRPSPADKIIVNDSLDEVGAADWRDKEYRTLSGGQKQRVLIARALACQPSVLVMDEPTNDMDVKGEEQIMQIVCSLRKQRNLSILLVSHLLNVVFNHVNSIAFLNRGRFNYFPEKHRLTADQLSNIFGIKVALKECDGKSFVFVA